MNQIGKSIDDDDVIQFLDNPSPIKVATATKKEILDILDESYNCMRVNNVPCRYLNAETGKWKKGTLYLALTFVPDEEKVLDTPIGREDVREE